MGRLRLGHAQQAMFSEGSGFGNPPIQNIRSKKMIDRPPPLFELGRDSRVLQAAGGPHHRR